MIRPSMVVRLDLHSASYEPELELQLKHAYLPISPLQVNSVEEDQEQVIQLDIKMHAPYWDAGDAVSNENWEASVLKWLGNMLYKVSNVMVNMNCRRIEQGLDVLRFDWLELRFANNALVAIHLDARSGIPSITSEAIEAVRAAVAGGTIPANPRVRIPSRASFASQYEAALAEWKASSSEEAQDGTDAEMPEEPRFEDLAFEIDYTTWELEDEQGIAEELASLL